MHRSVSWTLLSLLGRLGLLSLGVSVFLFAVAPSKTFQCQSVRGGLLGSRWSTMAVGVPGETCSLRTAASMSLDRKTTHHSDAGRRRDTASDQEGCLLQEPLSKSSQTCAISRGFDASSSGHPMSADCEGDAPRRALDKRLDHGVRERVEQERPHLPLVLRSEWQWRVGVIDLRFSSSSLSLLHLLVPLLVRPAFPSSSLQTEWSAARATRCPTLRAVLWNFGWPYSEFYGSRSARLTVMAMNGAVRAASHTTSVVWPVLRVSYHPVLFWGVVSPLWRVCSLVPFFDTCASSCIFSTSPLLLLSHSFLCFTCSVLPYLLHRVSTLPSYLRPVLSSHPFTSFPPWAVPSPFPIAISWQLHRLPAPCWADFSSPCLLLQTSGASLFSGLRHSTVLLASHWHPLVRSLWLFWRLFLWRRAHVVTVGIPVLWLHCHFAQSSWQLSCDGSRSVAQTTLACGVRHSAWPPTRTRANLSGLHPPCTVRWPPDSANIHTLSDYWSRQEIGEVVPACQGPHRTRRFPTKDARTKNECPTSSAAFQEMRCSVRAERQVAILATGW